MIDVARILFAQKEYRSTAPIEDTSIKTKHPLAAELEYNTLLRSEADGNTFGAFILGLRKLDRWTWACFVSKENILVPTLEVGVTVTIFYPRFGLSGGKNFIVKRIKTSANALFDELTLFGPEGIEGPAPDTTPSAFDFTNVTGAALNALIVSNEVVIAGIDSAAPVSVSGCEWAKKPSGGSYGSYTTSSGTVVAGDTVRLRLTSSSSPSTPVAASITIGGVLDNWTVTTQAASDTTPNPFSFTDQTGVALGTVITSNSITPSGYDTASPISVTGGEYEINASGTWLTSSGTISPGQSVRVRHTSSASGTTTVNTVLTIGGVSDTFSSTTQAAPALTVFLAILGGQSNMEGRNGSSTRDPLVDTNVTDAYQFVGTAADPNYRTISSDITPLLSVDPFEGAGGYGSDRVGPGEYIARQLLEDNPGTKVLIVPCAVGGTTITTGDQKWLSSATPGAGGTLFENMITHSNLAYTAAQAMWSGATIVPIFYFVQGEFDASQGADPATYRTELKNIISRARARITGASSAPFILGSMVPLKWLPDSATFTQVYADINYQHVMTSLEVSDCYYVRGPGDKTTGAEDFLHYSPIPFTRLQGRGLAAVLEDSVGPTITSAGTAGTAIGSPLSLPLVCDDLHATFHITGGANSGQFEISDPYLTPTLRWIGNSNGPAAGDYVVQIQARDGAGNFGPTKTITVTQSTEVSPSSYYVSGELGMAWDLQNANIFQNIDGTGAVAVGDPVGWVRDLSGNGNHWIAAANNTTRPILRVDGDGIRYLEFDGTNDILFALPFIKTNNGENTVIMGVFGAAPSSTRNLISNNSTTSTLPFLVSLQAQTAGNVTMSMRNDSSSSGGAGPSVAGIFDGATKRVLTSQYEGNGLFERIRDAATRPSGGGYGNYTEIDQGTFANTFSVTRASLGGSGFGTPSAFFPGRLYPGIAISRPFTETETRNAENWVAARTLVAALP